MIVLLAFAPLLSGIGGVGKSELARQYMNTRKHFFDAVFFISADTDLKMDESLSEITVALQLLGLSQAKDRLASKVAVFHWLSNPYLYTTKFPETAEQEEGVLAQMEPPRWLPARWLLVFDDVQSEALLKEYIPPAGPGSVLFTSRNPSAKHYLSPQSGMDLLPPAAEDAAALLQQLTYPARSPQELGVAIRLVKRIDCLPIAILHVAGIIKSQDSTFNKALSRYENDLTILKDADMAMTQGTYAQTLPTVWALDALPPPALALLRVLSLLDHQRIQESVFRSDEARQVNTLYPLANDFDEVMTALTTSSLVHRDKSAGILSVHQVVQDVARQMMTKEDLADSFQATITLVASNWKNGWSFAFGHRLEDWEVADFVVPHIWKIAAHFRLHNPTLQPLRWKRSQIWSPEPACE